MSDRQFCTAGICIDIYGDEELEIKVAGQRILFEFSEQFGPMPVYKGGRERPIRPKHPFWRAVSLWKLHGKRLDGSLAIWHEPRKPVLKHIGGRHYRVIEDGEPGHDW